MDLTKSFFDSYSRKENSLDCVEKNYTKYPEPINRILQEKKSEEKNTQLPPPQNISSLSYTSL